MKKNFTLAAFVASTLSFAQVNPQEGVQQSTDESTSPQTVISGNFVYSDPTQFGIAFELEGKRAFWREKEKSSTVANISVGTMEYEIEDLSFDGTGFVVEIGHRNYYGEEGRQFKGIYTSNYLSYGSIEFDEALSFAEFKGTYSYFSFFSPELGYKIKAGNFIIDPFVGATWKIEIKGKGDIDNRYTDEWAFRGGIKLGYRF